MMDVIVHAAFRYLACLFFFRPGSKSNQDSSRFLNGDGMDIVNDLFTNRRCGFQGEGKDTP